MHPWNPTTQFLPSLNLWGFSGALTGTTNPQNLVLSGPLSVTANFTLPVKLSIGLASNGQFARGETGATFTVAVKNVSSAATSGPVTVSDALPTGMTLVSMAGSGWNCAGDTCSRSDSLPGDKSYPQITVTVKISATASSPLVNSVTVSGGGAPLATATDSVTIRRN